MSSALSTATSEFNYQHFIIQSMYTLVHTYVYLSIFKFNFLLGVEFTQSPTVTLMFEAVMQSLSSVTELWTELITGYAPSYFNWNISNFWILSIYLFSNFYCAQVIRNSWGTGWGVSGYVLFKRGVNLCTVEDLPVKTVVIG